MKKYISPPTQRYDIPYGQIRKWFITTISVEIDEIRNQQWNVKRAIIFKRIILQRVRLVSGARNIRDRNIPCLDLWNKGAYEDLV